MYAAEGQCFVLAPCANVSKEMVELLCTDDVKRQLLRAGGGFTRIYAPDGSPISEPIAEDQEGILYAEIDLGMIALAKAAADPAGHYSRPDATRLLLNQTPGDRVVPFAMPGMEISQPAAQKAEQAARAVEREAKAAKKASAAAA
jgi:aliphatic nitrilase